MSKSYLKAVLKEYLKRKEFKDNLKDSFLKHFDVVRGPKLRRGFIHAVICDDLNLILNNQVQLEIREVLIDLGIHPMASNGRQYYKNVKVKQHVG